MDSYLKVKRQRRFHRFGFNFDSLLTRKIKELRILRFDCDVSLVYIESSEIILDSTCQYGWDSII